MKPCATYCIRARLDWILAVKVISKSGGSYQPPRLYIRDSASRFMYFIHSIFAHNPTRSYIDLNVGVLTCLHAPFFFVEEAVLLHTGAPCTTATTTVFTGELPPHLSSMNLNIYIFVYIWNQMSICMTQFLSYVSYILLIFYGTLPIQNSREN